MNSHITERLILRASHRAEAGVEPLDTRIAFYEEGCTSEDAFLAERAGDLLAKWRETDGDHYS